MGASQNKQNSSSELSEECKKEYFRQIKRDFSVGMKQINSTIHKEDISNQDNNWINYLLEKFTEYLNNNKIKDKHIRHILYYLNNLEESNEVKHIHNLSIYLKKEIEDMIQTNSTKQSFIERYYTEEEFKNNNNLMINLSKDEMLWRGSEFIFKDLEELNHPLNAFLRNLSFILSVVYEKEFEKLIISIEQNNSINIKDYHSDILIENRNSLMVRIFSNDFKNPISYTEENKSSDNSNFFIHSHCENKLLYNDYGNKQIEEFYISIHKELLIFSTFIGNALIRFYSIKNSTSHKLFEIFCEKIKDMLIRRDLYNLIYKIKSRLNHRKKENYSQRLIECYNIKPHYLCTSPYFSLDKNFREIIKKYMKCHKIKTFREDEEKHITQIPFNKSIVLLRQIRENDSIIKKIDIMYKIRTSILSEIDEFWKDIPLKTKYKSVDADNLLSIFIYLMIKAQIDSLIIDLEIIDDFTNRSLKLSRKGYFFSLFQSSIEYLISNLSISQLDLNIEEYNNMLNKELIVLDSSPDMILDISMTCDCQGCVVVIENNL